MSQSCCLNPSFTASGTKHALHTPPSRTCTSTEAAFKQTQTKRDTIHLITTLSIARQKPLHYWVFCTGWVQHHASYFGHGPSQRQTPFLTLLQLTWNVSKDRQSAMAALCSGVRPAKRGMLCKDSSYLLRFCMVDTTMMALKVGLSITHTTPPVSACTPHDSHSAHSHKLLSASSFACYSLYRAQSYSHLCSPYTAVAQTHQSKAAWKARTASGTDHSRKWLRVKGVAAAQTVHRVRSF